MIRLRLRSDSFIVASDAQAFVILAVLLITIGVTVTGMYFAIAVPLEIAKSEFNHAEAVTEDFIALQTSVHALERAESSVATTSVTIQLTPEKTSIIVPILSSGTIYFSPLQGSMAVQLAGENSSIPPPWTDDDFVNTTCPNLNPASGELKLAGPPYSSKGYAESNMTATEGHLGKDTGSNSTRYGNLTWYTSIRPNTELVIKVRTDMFPDMRHAKNWSDCPEIQSQNGYNELNLTALSSISHGHRYIQYRADLITYDSTETPTLFNLSINFSSSPEGVTLAYASGSITYASNYNYRPNHELSYENGAVIKNQAEGGFVANPSGLGNHVAFSNASGGVPSIDLSLVNLTGPEIPPYSGAPVISVRLFRGGYEQLISDSFYYPNLTLNITTNYPSIWSRWLNETLDTAGLVSGSDYDLLPPADDSVQVVFYGRSEGVKLYLDKATVQVCVTA